MNASRPSLMVVAGPNGSGKSTLTSYGVAGNRPVLDPDVVAARLSPGDIRAGAVQGAKETIRQQEELLERRESFAIETTLSGNRTLKLMDEAKARGYEVELHYVRLGTPQGSIDRVAERVARGGHDVPQEDILRRYERSLENLPSAIEKADKTTLYDNSGRRTEIVGHLDKEAFRFRDPPDWAVNASDRAARLMENNATTNEQREAAQMRAAEVAVAAGRMSEESLQELREFNRERDLDSDREGGVKEYTIYRCECFDLS